MACCVYAREAWSLQLGEKNRLMVFENRALRKIFWPKMYDVSSTSLWYWESLHTEEFCDLHSTPNIIPVIK
jgi:hypothetical protein